MMTERQQEVLKRGGIDPVRLDRRALGAIMNDEIPEARWAKQWFLIQRAGYKTYQQYLKAHNERKTLRHPQ
jgi:hypothetical protein